MLVSRKQHILFYAVSPKDLQKYFEITLFEEFFLDVGRQNLRQIYMDHNVPEQLFAILKLQKK